VDVTHAAFARLGRKFAQFVVKLLAVQGR